MSGSVDLNKSSVFIGTSGSGDLNKSSVLGIKVRGI